MRTNFKQAWATTPATCSPFVPGSSQSLATGGGEAKRATSRALGMCATIIRGGVGVLGSVAALVGMSDAVTAQWLIPAALVNFLWAAGFAWMTTMWGLLRVVMAVDVTLAVTFCVLQVHLLPREALGAGVSWVSVLASMCVVCTHVAWEPAVAIPVGLMVTLAYVVGETIAEAPDGGIPQAAVMVLQNLSTTALMTLVRRVSRAADAELDEYYRVEREARVGLAQRAAEREANRRLHDTVLATLTTVGSGAIDHSSIKLRAHARSDLAVVASLGHEVPVNTGMVRLDHMLRQLVLRLDPPLRVELTTCVCAIPDPVAESFAWAAAAALANVVLHADVTRASVDLRIDGETVVVAVMDRGRGFDPALLQPYQYGLREAIRGRIEAVGGRVLVESALGDGTRITMRWCNHE
jgi:signal transduction histidine kinase